MKTSLSSIDIAALVHELQPKLIGSWVNNIYSISENRVILRFRKSTESPMELVIELGKRFHFTKYVRKKPTSPNNKIMTLRKHIRNLPVNNFYQWKLDRVIVFEIAFKDGFYKLIVELFGDGNFILVGPNKKIISAYKYRRMKDRDIHPGKIYEYPPSPNENITTLTEENYESKLKSADGKITKFLNDILGLGPLYSNDILAKSRIDVKNVEELNEEARSALYNQINVLKEKITQHEYSYSKYMDDDEIVDITPIDISKYSELVKIETDSFNDELDDFFSLQEEEPEYTEDKEVTTGKITKFQKTLQSQENHLKKLILQEEEEKHKGDLLYVHFTAIDELLTTIVNARQNDISWDDILKKLELAREKDIPSVKILEKINPKTKQLWVSLFDEKTSENAIIELDFTQTLVDSANTFYEKSKKARRKIPGANDAIARSKKLIEEEESAKDEIIVKVESTPMVIKRKKRWYEKFHWFFCGELLIIGGTDATANEKILKTYLTDNDYFFHADVHGAPYVIAKDGLTNLTDECFQEIATFALNYSSLWKDNKLVGDVYRVLPDQVSLTPPTGQFLAKGSVMIYGEKQYLKNIEINHAVGLVIFENYAQIIGGPVKSVNERTEMLVEIKPGDVPKGKIGNQIKAKLAKQCPSEELHKLNALTVNDILPFIPGDAEIIE
ncbi:MAG: NFACT family protein [Candidatus Heimdallarchaeota archaeon]|nr:NFACT family protein [Candidatus Heimdallarchaeota archaeon]